jgi:hypothetical protein
MNINLGSTLRSTVEERTKERELDRPFPLNARKLRRLQAAADARQKRHGQRAFTNRQLARERTVDALRAQFAILDGKDDVPAAVYDNVEAAINRKVAFLVREDLKRYWREYELIADHDATQPRSVITREQAFDQLRGIAAGQ